MINYNIRTYAFAILGLAFATYIALFLATQKLDGIDFHKALSQISTTVSINIVIWLIFIKWAWKLRLFYPWLVPFPDISGEWEGVIISNGKEGQLDPIPIQVSISQSFFNVQIKIKTGESKSYSLGASFDIDRERGIQQLIYSYLNTPRPGVRERSEIHYGSTILCFTGYHIKEMEGEYWTTRATTGEIKIKKKNVA
jgi:hypothetical protein